jgi:ABC-type Zn uptake system ZnuABC Zn-binding protein ZnuA
MGRIVRAATWLGLAVLTLSVVACSDTGSAGGGKDGVTVVTSIGILEDMVRQVGGDRVEVSTVISGDPHTFSPRPQDAQSVAGADLVVINGLGLEAGFERLARNTVDDDRILVLAEGLPREPAEGADAGHAPDGDNHEDGGDEHEEGDPHYWLNPRYGMAYVERLRDALSEVDPEGREEYEANAARYVSELETVDAEFERSVERIPPERRKLVTAHRAFGHLAERYGLEQVGFVVNTAEQQASAGGAADLVRLIREQEVRAVFSEPQVRSSVLESIAAEAGVEVRVLLSDAFGEGVDSYLGLLRFNMEQITQGLGGSPPSGD